MSETQQSPVDHSAPPDPAAAAEDAAKKRARTSEVLEEILRRMDLPGRVEVKDGADGGISVAMFLESEVPQGQGRRSNFIDALQFLANKVVNRPGTSRRWISIGVGAHPEPRAPRPPPGPAPEQAAPQQRPRPVAPPPLARPPRPQAPAPQAHAHGHTHAAPPPPSAQPAELTMELSEDPAAAALGKALANKSVQHGRFYAVWPMKLEDRARLLRASQGVAGVTVALEGEGRNRRVVYSPDKPTPMPKRTLPVHDDEG